uniref:Ser/Thr protein kinase, putative n=1 Tax=Babesia bovis TaxID=5865 RepID=A7AUS8_BABBO|eukprot:XP_001610257.1 Ser/Thr protein kinase [Babesia bovis T2Bo]
MEHEQEQKDGDPDAGMDSRANRTSDYLPKGASSADISARSTLHALWYTIDDFDIGGLVGDGAHGQVFVARERRTGFICVIKCISKTLLTNSKQEAIFKREIELHGHLRHPHIASIFTWFSSESMVYIVLEYCINGDLYTYLNKHGRLSEQRAAEICFEVTWAIRTCHDKHIAHLDLKPENILLDHNYSCKLADFGLSAHVGATDSKVSHMRGTYDYWSPEQSACKYNNEGQFGEVTFGQSGSWYLSYFLVSRHLGQPLKRRLTWSCIVYKHVPGTTTGSQSTALNA